MLRGKKIGIIGTGNMGRALARGLIQASVIPPDHLLLADRKAERLTPLVQELGAQAYGVETLIPECDVIILAVKPQDMEALLQPLQNLFHKEQLFISIAAGLRTDRARC